MGFLIINLSLNSGISAFSNSFSSQQPENDRLRQIHLINESEAESLLEVRLSATEWQWRVRKVGVFCCEVMTCWVRSNYDVLVDFEGFFNLTDSAAIQIGTWYAISQSPPPPPPKSDEWIPAAELNNADFIIPTPVGGVSWNLWSMIEVTDRIRAGEYQNAPTITFVVQGLNDWIEPELSYEAISRFFTDRVSKKD